MFKNVVEYCRIIKGIIFQSQNEYTTNNEFRIQILVNFK